MKHVLFNICLLFGFATIVQAQSISIDQNSFTKDLVVPDTASDSFTISNAGSADLDYSISGQALSLSSPISVLMYAYNPDGDLSSQATLNSVRDILSTDLPSAVVLETQTEDPTVLASLLSGKSVFLVPRIRKADPALFAAFADVLNDFVEAGGNVVFLGTDLLGFSTINNVVFASGLFSGEINGFITDPQFVDLNVESGSPFTEGLNNTIPGAATTFYYSITNDDKNTVVSYDAGLTEFDVVTSRDIGMGQAVLIGFNYLFSNESTRSLLINVLKETGISTENFWLRVSPEAGTVAAGDNETINLTFDATSIPAGSYSIDLTIEHNGSEDSQIVNCNLNTTGTAAIDVPVSVVDFGNVVATTSKSVAVQINNPGTDLLFVTGVTISGDFPITVSQSEFSVFPGLNNAIILTYNPTTVESFSETLTIQSNAGTEVVQVSGVATGAPTIAFSSPTIEYTIDAGNVESTTWSISNAGEGDLIYDLAINLDAGLQLEFESQDSSNAGLIQFFDKATEEMVLEISFEPGESFDEILTELNSPGVYSLIITDAGIGGYNYGVDVRDLVLSDVATGTTLIDELFPITNIPFEFIGSISTWISTNPENGTIAFVAGGGTNSEDIAITFDATSLIAGVYNTELVVNPSEPLQEETVDIVLTVLGVPKVSLSESGLDFGEVIDGLSNTLSFEIFNSGTAELEVTDLIFNDPSYVADMSQFTVAPLNTKGVFVSFSPPNQGVFNTQLTVQTNAGDFVVDLLGVGLGAPLASITPGSISVNVFEDEIVDTSFTLFNSGASDLLYELGIGEQDSGFELVFSAGSDGADYIWFLNGSDGFFQSGGEILGPGEMFSSQVTGLDAQSDYNIQIIDLDGSVSLSVIDLGTLQEIVTDSEEDFLEVGAPSLVSWIEIPEGEFETGFPGETSIPITFNSTGLLPGEYTNRVLVLSNDPENPIVALDVSMTIIAPPVAGFEVSSKDQCGEESIQFTNTTLFGSDTWLWIFGDGTTSNLENPSHTYASSGIYTVVLQSCNELGCDEITEQNIIEVDLACTFASVIMDEQSILTSCNGFVYDSGGPNNDYGNNSNGQITIQPAGASSVTLSFLEFNYEEPFDGLQIFDGPDIFSPLLAELSGSELPDAITSSGDAITIQEVTDGNVGRSGFVGRFVCSAPSVAPAAAINIETTSGCSGLLNAMDISENFANSWSWNFGDGATAISPNPQHQYSEGGTYTVTLEVCNDFGCDTVSEDITVELLIPIVIVPTETVASGQNIQFMDNTEGAGLWLWDFGDGGQSTSQNPVHAYAESGIYTVTVSIQNVSIAECTIEFSQDVFVDIGVGIDDETESNFSLFPNPAQDYFILEFDLGQPTPAFVFIFDIYGRTLFTERFDSSLSQKISVNDFPVGVYNVLIVTEGHEIVRRIVVSK